MAKQREAIIQQLQQQVVELEQNNDRLTAELAQLRQENEHLRQSRATACAQQQSAQERSAKLVKANTALQQTLAALAEEKEID